MLKTLTTLTDLLTNELCIFEWNFIFKDFDHDY